MIQSSALQQEGRELKNTPNFFNYLASLIMKATLLIVSLCFVSLLVQGGTQKDSSFLATLRSQYTTAYRDLNNNGYIVEQSGKYGYIGSDGEVIVAPYYEQICNFHNGLASVRLDKKWGWIDLQGKEVIPARYENPGEFKNGMAIASLDGKYGWIDTEGNIVIDFLYDWVKDFRNDGIAVAKKHNKWGWIDRTGKIAIPFEFDKIDDYEGGLVRVVQGENTFYINKYGHCVEDCYHLKETTATAQR